MKNHENQNSYIENYWNHANLKFHRESIELWKSKITYDNYENHKKILEFPVDNNRNHTRL